MNPQQFPLLKIRRQPAPNPELRVRSEFIRRYVAEKLEGYQTRQAARVARRKLERDQDERTAAQRKEQTNVRVIKISFRAIFEGPKGALNAMGLKMPGRFAVEVYQATPGKWKAREIDTPARRVHERLRAFANATDGKRIVEANFDNQVEPWQMWGIPPGENSTGPRLLLPEEIHECAGGVYQFRGPEDFTHIGTEIHGNNVTTLCDARVSHKLIVSTRANIAPSCPTCAKRYAEEFAHA